MSRSRRVVFISMLVVVVGVGAGLSALYLDPARAAVGPLPAAALVLPQDSRFVIGLDVRRYVASPLYARVAPEMRPDALRELEERTGLRPDRDLDQIVIAGRAAGPSGLPLALVLGQFDRQKLGRTIETEKKGKVTWKDVQGTTVYLFKEGEKGTGALAFLDDSALLIGAAEAVETALGNRARGTGGLRGNAELTALLEKVRPGSAFWMVGDQSLLANLPKSVTGPAGDAQVTLPALRSLTVTGDLDPLVSLSVTGEASDPAGATNLADVVRGFLALAALQAGQKPELKALASAITVATDQNRVLVNARIPYETLDALQGPRKAASAPAPETR
ncbi:MAG TPA: hypothetical protein VIC87_17825 [Vicinamibacteria bacterium]